MSTAERCGVVCVTGSPIWEEPPAARRFRRLLGDRLHLVTGRTWERGTRSPADRLEGLAGLAVGLVAAREDTDMVDQVPAMPLGVLTDEAQAFALVGGAEDTERFTFGGATVVIGPVGTVIVTDAGDRGPDRSEVWNSEEVRLFGPAPAPITERLTGRTWKWGADDEVLPVHLMIRIDDGLLYLGVSRIVSAATAQRPGGSLSRGLLEYMLAYSKPVAGDDGTAREGPYL